MFVCVAGCLAGIHAQDSLALRRLVEWNAIAKPGSTVEWLKLRDDTHFSHSDFFEKNRHLLGLEASTGMQLLKTESDELGMQHHRFAEYHEGYRVYGAEYVLHENDGRITHANGSIVKQLPAPPPVALSEASALAMALRCMPGDRYRWLDAHAEELLQEKEHDPAATFFPKGELVWVARDPSLGTAADNMVLAWRFDVYMSDGGSARLFLDPENGALIRRIPLEINCDPGTGTTTWNGNVALNTSQSGMQFVLRDDCQSPNIRVRNGNFSLTPNVGATDFTDADNNWLGQQSAVQTFFGLNQTWLYFLNTFSRNSFDGGGANIEAYNNAAFGTAGNLNFANASWNGSFIRFGDHNGTGTSPNDDWNPVDIVGHEFTHAVTGSEANLDYELESGALNESFSDIFGEMVELFAEGANDWLVGGDRTPGAIRSMSNPNAGSQPDTYEGTNWIAPSGTCDNTNDNCGVHTNSGVQNFWFFLLSVGGSGTNDNGEVYEVEGIGAASAAAIAYRNLTVYLGNTSNHTDAKNGAIRAAEDLFGECSNEALQCARAWNAVGVNTGDLIGYDISTDCPTLNLLHNAFVPVLYTAFNDIRSDCSIASNGVSVEFEAGHAVVLRPGFRSGDNFHAFVNPCSGTKSAKTFGSATDREQTGYDNRPKLQTNLVLEVFPNPFAGEFSLRFHLDDPAPVDLQLTDALGKTVHRWFAGERLEAGTHNITASQLPLAPGVYYVHLGTPSGKRLQKIVKLSH